MKKVIGLGVLLASGSAMADGESTNIVTQLVGAVDTSTLIATVASIGLVAVGVKFGEKGITFVKRLIGKV
ncbi:hypothetical protein VV7356_24205 (plasmid) [Vibrio vulnificus]|uniref:hypothetical protein n=1 Tax=Vibrio vulnificus TaxID=672 RepID=UPI000CD2CFE7|nr:hypothetical protein [Vibrio vulnificus]POC64931.1 hypothetical protein CRN44_07045 [Vibrio vulnificus]